MPVYHWQSLSELDGGERCCSGLGQGLLTAISRLDQHDKTRFRALLSCWVWRGEGVATSVSFDLDFDLESMHLHEPAKPSNRRT